MLRHPDVQFYFTDYCLLLYSATRYGNLAFMKNLIGISLGDRMREGDWENSEWEKIKEEVLKIVSTNL